MKITLHRTIAEIKTTESRIKTLVSRYSNSKLFVGLYNKSKKAAEGGIARDEVIRNIQGNVDKFNALYKNLTNLKFGLVNANAGLTSSIPHDQLETAEVCGKQYTILEILALKKILGYKTMLKDKLTEEYVSVTSSIEQSNKDNKDRLDRILTQFADKKADDKSNSAIAIKATTEAFWETNGLEMIDPLGIKSMIDSLDREINAYSIEIDAALSQSNALRTIEVDLEG